MLARIVNFVATPRAWIAGLSGSAILVLFWALRGAPIGRAPEEVADAPGADYRNRVVAAAILGLGQVAVGAYLAAVVGVPWSLPLFVIGFGVLIVLVRVNRRYRHASPTLRRVVSAADTALTASLLAGVLIVGNVLAFKYGGRPIDLTRERTYSLESLTINQLKSLDRPLTFTVFAGRGPRAVRQVDRIVQLLDLYKAENPGRIRVEILNSTTDLPEMEDLAKRVPDVAVTPGGGVVIESGAGDSARRAVVRNSEMFEVGRQGSFDPERFASTFRGEDALTSALIRLREGKRIKIAITTGHGEASVHEMDPNKPGLGLLQSRLTSFGAAVIVHNPVRDPIPPDTEVLIVAGPQTPFQPVEVERVNAYVENGGHVLAIVGNQATTGLEGWLKSRGVAIEPGVVLDSKYQEAGRPWLVLAPILGDARHPIVDSLLGRAVLMPNAAPLAIGGDAARGVVVLRSSPESWAETDLNDPDPTKRKPGPQAVGVALTDPGGEAPRLVVLSSPRVADNVFVALDPTNLDLLSNAVNWLRGRSDLQGIAPRTHVALTLSADPDLRKRLVLVPTLIALTVIIGLGVTTYLARRD